MRFGQRMREDAELVWGEGSKTHSFWRSVRRPARVRRSPVSGSSHGEPGDPRVDWDYWDPEVYSSGFGSGRERDSQT